MCLRALAWLAVSLLMIAQRAQAAAVPVGFTDRPVADGLTSPTALTALPDGRVLVLQQNGAIRVVQNDALLAASFWEVPNVDITGERGCLGITPDPDFAANHYLYVYCTIQGQTSNNQLIRVTEADGVAVAGSAQVLFTLPEVTSLWHMGGALRFGPDGMLYVAVGNHEDDVQSADVANSQKLSNPFGKILRVRRDGSAPEDNPFVGQAGAYEAIWSFGYRNPFAFDIQPGTGRMFVGDVGQGAWEEINDNKRGANYGWPIAEGPVPNPAFERPFYAYQHTKGRCAVTGGAFYDPQTAQFPASYVGKFLFQDFCVGTIEVLDTTTAEVTPFVTDIGFPTNLLVTADGSVYYLSRNQDTMTHEPGVGSLNKLTYSGSGAPRISRSPKSQTIVEGEPVTFEVTVDGAERIQWRRDGADISGATEVSYTLAKTVAEDDGAVFVAVASNAAGAIESGPARLTITRNRPPEASLASAGGESLVQYVPGQTLSFAGQGIDPEDGMLSADAFTWQVDFQHDSHTHPLLAAESGKESIDFQVPDFEAEEANTWLRVHLTVRDAGGTSHAVYEDVFPGTQLSTLTPIDPVNGLGPVEPDLSNGGDGAGDGAPLAIGGIAYLKGFGVSAPSELRFALDGRCTGKLLADVGIDDEVGDAGSVVFQAYLDGKLIFDSGTLHGSDARQNLAVGVVGVRELRLVVTDAGDGNADDHADWAAARVTGCSDDNTPVDEVPPDVTPTAAGSGGTDNADAGAGGTGGSAGSTDGELSASGGRSGAGGKSGASGGRAGSSGGSDNADDPDDADGSNDTDNTDTREQAATAADGGAPEADDSPEATEDGGCSVTPRGKTHDVRGAAFAALGLLAWTGYHRRRAIRRSERRSC
ncbi:MAG: PQQ-dependent sugar dehydrogenase [Polyangiales bacterium]